jgi:hypothetical protein
MNRLPQDAKKGFEKKKGKIQNGGESQPLKTLKEWPVPKRARREKMRSTEPQTRA